MVLLTSSQVSVVISSAIVLSFTSALFLSGYVLQQATLRDLRAAIKPQMVRPLPELQVYLPPQFRDDDLGQRGVVDATPVEVEIFAEAEKPKDGTGYSEDTKEHIDTGEAEQGGGDDDDMIGATRWQKEKRRKEKLLAESQKAQKPIVDIETPIEPETIPVDSTRNVEQIPLSKAERRKKIREEVLASGEGEGFQGYRRRMW